MTEQDLRAELAAISTVAADWKAKYLNATTVEERNRCSEQLVRLYDRHEALCSQLTRLEKCA